VEISASKVDTMESRTCHSASSSISFAWCGQAKLQTFCTLLLRRLALIHTYRVRSKPRS